MNIFLLTFDINLYNMLVTKKVRTTLLCNSGIFSFGIHPTYLKFSKLHNSVELQKEVYMANKVKELS